MLGIDAAFLVVPVSLAHLEIGRKGNTVNKLFLDVQAVRELELHVGIVSGFPLIRRTAVAGIFLAGIEDNFYKIDCLPIIRKRVDSSRPRNPGILAGRSGTVG